MNVSRNGIHAEEKTIRWFEVLAPVAVPLISVVVSLWVARAVYEEKFINQEKRLASIEASLDKQDDRITAIYQALADIRSGVAEIKGRLAFGETTK